MRRSGFVTLTTGRHIFSSSFCPIWIVVTVPPRSSWGTSIFLLDFHRYYFMRVVFLSIGLKCLPLSTQVDDVLLRSTSSRGTSQCYRALIIHTPCEAPLNDVLS